MRAKPVAKSAACMVFIGVTLGANAFAQNGTPLNPHSNEVLTLAVYGDAPYGATNNDTSQTDATGAFVRSINSDPKVDLILHVGDIHSGKQFCTEAYDRTIADLWTAFKNPLIYTPGDNEWSDCHKAAEGGHVRDVNGNPVAYADGDPAANLDLVRTIFFSTPGYSLGGRKKRVLSQAQSYDSSSPSDGDYVENVMWEQSKVLFVTLNIPGGSNNDADNWFGVARTQAQTDEIASRTRADLNWLAAAFLQAGKDDVEAIVIQQQADMWDRDGKAVSHLANYETFIAQIASLTKQFGRPVLLFEGDSHIYRSDNPLQPGQPCAFEHGSGSVDCRSIPDPGDGTYTPDAWTNHPGYDVSNFHRVVVHGSTAPLEWLRLTITPGAHATPSTSAFGPFSWERVVTTLP